MCVCVCARFFVIDVATWIHIGNVGKLKLLLDVAHICVSPMEGEGQRKVQIKFVKLIIFKKKKKRKWHTFCKYNSLAFTLSILSEIQSYTR